MSLLTLGAGGYGASNPNTHSIDFEASSNQYLSRTDAAQVGLDITGNITIELWTKLESSPPNNNSFRYVSKWAGAGQNAYLFDYLNDAGTFKLRFIYSADGSTNTILTYTVTLNTGTWYHIAISANVGATTGNFYVNTVENAASVSGAGTAIFNGAHPFTIGSDANPGEYVDGLVDDVRVWSTNRSQAQIAANYNIQLVGNESNLQGYWRFNNALTDLTANGNTLTNNNAATFSADIPF